MTRARYIMIGGFLGAGKTTAMLKLAERLRQGGRRVGLITNDQSVGLVDTELLGARDFPVEEITGGCFCCKFDALLDAARTLTSDARPEVLLAEPVGSCTDLKATVCYPLRQLYGSDYSIAPYSVLIDPIRAQRIFGLTPGANFSSKVGYIYLKQLEEAEILVINKCDLLTSEELSELSAELRRRYPGKPIQHVSARHGTNLDGWLQAIEACDLSRDPAMEVDYDLYAEGEALLGWVNLTAGLRCDEKFDGNRFLKSMASELRTRLQVESAEIAHLKMTLTPDAEDSVAVLNLVRNDVPPGLSFELPGPITSGALLVNLRAEFAPEFLRDATVGALEKVAKSWRLSAEVERLEAFRPGRPTPTHRLAQI